MKWWKVGLLTSAGWCAAAASASAWIHWTNKTRPAGENSEEGRWAIAAWGSTTLTVAALGAIWAAAGRLAFRRRKRWTVRQSQREESTYWRKIRRVAMVR